MIGKRTVSLKSSNAFLAQIAYLITVLEGNKKKGEMKKAKAKRS